MPAPPDPRPRLLTPAGCQPEGWPTSSLELSGSTAKFVIIGSSVAASPSTLSRLTAGLGVARKGELGKPDRPRCMRGEEPSASRGTCHTIVGGNRRGQAIAQNSSSRAGLLARRQALGWLLIGAVKPFYEVGYRLTHAHGVERFSQALTSTRQTGVAPFGTSCSGPASTVSKFELTNANCSYCNITMTSWRPALHTGGARALLQGGSAMVYHSQSIVYLFLSFPAASKVQPT